MIRKYNIWFTSDLHFYHKNVIKYCNRPFKDIEEMNKTLINNWNSSVEKEDIVIVLGDVFFCGYEKAKKIMDSLNGTKILVKGNHDTKYSKLYRYGFDFVCESMDLGIAKNRVHLSHYPYKISFFEKLKNKLTFKKQPRYLNRRLKNDNKWLIHGHTHSDKKLNGKQIHIGVDSWEFKPVHISIIEYIIQNGKVPNKKLNKSKEVLEWKL